MIQLVAIERAIKYRNEDHEGLVLLGYNSLLFPVIVYEDGSIQWHVVVKQWHVVVKNKLDAGHSMLADLQDNLEGLVPKKIDIPPPDAIGYLGWCREVKLTLGTREMDSNISRSKLNPIEIRYKPMEYIHEIASRMAVSFSPFNIVSFCLAGERLSRKSNSRSRLAL